MRMVLIVLGIASLCINCQPDLQKTCNNNDECIEGYLCDKKNHCVKVEQKNMEILVNELDDSIVGKKYSYTLSVRGGLPPYTWSVVAGPEWLKTEHDANSGKWQLTGVPDTYQDIGVLVGIEVTDDSIETQKTGKNNLSIRSFYCLASEETNEACSGHGSCDTNGVCECNQGYAGNQCGTEYEYKCEPEGECGADAYRRSCTGGTCEENWTLIGDCSAKQICWSSDINAGCTTCGDECIDGECYPECNPITQGCCTPEGEIIDTCWYDAEMNLSWENPESGGIKTWDQAVSHCNALKLGGLSWRLPTISELRSLIRGCSDTQITKDSNGKCKVTDDCLGESSCYEYIDCMGCKKDEGPGSSGCYWDHDCAGICISYWSYSESIYDYSKTAWKVDFEYGSIIYAGKEHGSYVRCVRDGP